ncbi:type II toxin-antitoxin system VapC family toxin [Candidatus Gottesmanbacteria bacterium]|nr:type II toxin-antitoxin system VapC family toxin [Candidatus Gottesmanbacteria bacterium]
MTKIFYDTDLLIALHDSSDILHVSVKEYWNKMLSYKLQPFLSTNVLLEVLTIISQRVSKNHSLNLLRELRSGKYIIIHPNEDLISKGEEIFKFIKSKSVSYSDCLNFAILKEYSINWVYSFDVHFKKRGFKRFGIDGYPINTTVGKDRDYLKKSRR